jgi:hypothetical protein
MKAYGGVDIKIHLFLTSLLVRGECSALRHSHFTLWGNIPRYPLDRRLGGPQNRSGRHGDKILAPVITRTPTPRPSNSKLYWLLCMNSNEQCYLLGWSLLEFYRRFGGTGLLSACFLLGSSYVLFDPEDGGSISFLKVDKFYLTTQCHTPNESKIHSYHVTTISPTFTEVFVISLLLWTRVTIRLEILTAVTTQVATFCNETL